MPLSATNTPPVWGQWISRIREKIKARAAIQSSTNALMLAIDELGTHGGCAVGTPLNSSAFASINELIPSADVNKLLRSQQLLKRARVYTFKHPSHYMEFFTAVEQVVEHASTPLPAELQGFLEQYHHQKLLLEAIEQNNVAHVADLIAHAHPTCNSSLALRTAAKQGHIHCVAQLIGVSSFEPYNEYMTSALQLAAAEGHADCVDLLLPHAHPSTYASSCRRAALHAHKDIVQTLLPLVDDEKSQEIFSAAAQGGNLEIVLMVEQKFADLECAEALKAASLAGHTQCVEYLANKTTAHDAAETLRELSAGPGCYGKVMRKDSSHLLDWTPEQKQCAKILITHCNAPKVLYELQTQFPHEPWNWLALEEQLRETQRMVLEQVVEHPQRAHARRKM